MPDRTRLSAVVIEEIFPGVKLLRPMVHADERGFLLEVLREEALGVRFLQANHSHSKAGVLRGLHYHRRQADAWYFVAGQAQVGLADLRITPDHPPVRTLELSAETPTVLYIPPGVAHGYLALHDVDLIYWTTAYYDRADEHAIAWNATALGVPWRTTNPVLSLRDALALPFDRQAVNAVLRD